MAWYRTGTLSVTNGSVVVTGVGTSWISQHKGWILVTEQGNELLEIGEIVSSTELALAVAFTGTTAATLTYSIIPTQSLNADLVEKINDLITIYNANNP
jgi:hypothetical protein